MSRDLTGKAVGGYRLGEVLGRGAHGSVYAAEHSASGRKVAVKVFAADLSRDKNAAARLVVEVQKATAVKHPLLVPVLDVGTVEHKGKRHLYIAMERLEGESLRARLQKDDRPLPLHLALQIACDVGAALNAIHREGKSHRALDAGAVFLLAGGEADEEIARVLDLGTARVLGAERGDKEDEKGEEAGQQEDLRALALLLKQMLAGKEAAADAGPGPLRLRNREVPVHVDVAIRRALDPDQSQSRSYPSVAAFVADVLHVGPLLPSLGVWSEGGVLPPPPRVRGGINVGWVVLALAGVGGVGWWLYHREASGPLPVADLSPPAQVAAADLGAERRDLSVAVAVAAAPDLGAAPDLAAPAAAPEAPHKKRPKRTGPPIPPLRAPDGSAGVAPAPAAAAPAAPAAAPPRKRPKRTGPSIPPLRP